MSIQESVDNDREVDHPSLWLNGKGYGNISDGEGALISLHQLVSCLHTDPHRVFAEGTEVHHRLGHAGLLEIPGNLVVRDVDEYRDKHQGDSVDRPLIDIVLGFDE